MPYKKRGFYTIREWVPDDDFDPEVDRLLITTDWGDTFVACMAPDGTDSLSLIVDPEFMPDNLGTIPSELRYRTVPLNWDATKLPWYIFLYDGEMTGSGPKIDMVAVGTGGWTRPIRTSLVYASIESVRKQDIITKHLAHNIDGVYFGEYTINEAAMYDVAIKG